MIYLMHHANLVFKMNASETAQKPNYVVSSMFGLSLIATKDFETAALIVSGNYDFELKCAIFSTLAGTSPTNPEQLEEPRILEGLDKIKNSFRLAISNAMNQVLKNDERKAKASRIERMAKQHSQSAVGTVAEIAKEFGISKSEARRMRADGTLDAFVASKRSGNA